MIIPLSHDLYCYHEEKRDKKSRQRGVPIKCDIPAKFNWEVTTILIGKLQQFQLGSYNNSNWKVVPKII